MRVSRIEVQKKDKSRYSVYLDDSFWLGVSEGTLIKFNLAKGQTLTPEECQTIRDYEQEESLYLRAIKHLSRALKSSGEVYDYLKAQALKQADLDSLEAKEDFLAELEPYLGRVIGRLVSQGYLDDALYGRSLVLTEARVGRKGPQLIGRKLQDKGLTASQVAQALEAYETDLLEENIQTLIEKFYKSHRRLPAGQLKRKVQEHLLTKGYSLAMIQPYLEDCQPEADLDHEADLVDQAASKARRQLSRRHEGKALILKIKESLYRKGFDLDLVNQWLDAQDWEEPI